MILLFLLTLVGATIAGPQDYSLAKRYEQDKVFRSAAEYYKRYLNDKPASDKVYQARWGLARSLNKLNQQDEALFYYDLLDKEHPHAKEKDQILFEMAELLEKLQKQASADKYYQVALMGRSKLHRKAHYKSVDRSYSYGDLESAKTRAKTFLKKYKKGNDISQIYLWLGLASINEKAFEKAVDYLQLSLELVENTETWLALGRVEVQLKTGTPSVSFQRAAKDTTQIGKAAEKELVALWSEQKKFGALAEWYLKNNTTLELSDQLKVFEALIESRKSREALLALKQLQVDESLLKKERQVIKGRALLGVSERLDGIRVLKEVGETGYVDAWKYIAKAYDEDEMYLNSIQVMYRIMEYSVADERPDVMLNIAKTYEEKLSRYSTAKGVYQQFERDFPNNESMPFAIMGIARCLEKEDELIQAAKYYERVYEDYPLSEFASLAKSKKSFIDRHETKDLNGAVDKFSDLLLYTDETKKKIELAKVQLESVKNYKKAFVLLKKVYADSTTVKHKNEIRFLMSKALMEQSDYDKNKGEVRRALEFKNKALAHYNGIVDDSTAGVWKELAAYELLKINVFKVESYKAFVKTFPNSKFEGEIYYTIGSHYLKEYRELKTPVSDKAVANFQKVLNLKVNKSLKRNAMAKLAESYLAAGQAPKALSTLDMLAQWEDKSFKNAQVLLTRGKVLIALQKTDEAIKSLNEVHYRFRSTPEAGEALVVSAKVLEEKEEWLQASKQYRMFINSYPSHDGVVDAYLSLAKIKSKVSTYKSAYELLGEFLNEYKNSKKSYLVHQRMAQIATWMDDRLKAAGHYESALNTAPLNESDVLSIKAAEVFLALEKYDKSLELFTKAESLLAKPKQKAIALSGRVSSLTMLGQRKAYDKAFKEFRNKYEDEDEAYARIIYYEARKKMDDGNNEKAIKRFEYLVDRFEETSWSKEGFYYTGVIAFKRGKYTESINHFEKYLANSKLGKNVTEAKFKLAGAYFQLSQFHKSAEIYEKISEGEQGSDLLKYRSRYNAAITFEKIEDWYRAALMYSKIFERDQAYLTNNNLKVSAGFAWFNAGEYSKALTFFKEVVNTKGSERMAEAHYWYAKTLDHNNRVEEAIEEYLKVSYLYRGNGMWGLTAVFEVGQIYERSADYDRAERMYQQIVDQDGTQGTLGARALIYLEKMRERR